MADWVVAACAVVSLVGAGVSWWMSNKSKAARVASQQAAEHADATLAAIQRQAAAVEELAAAVRPDDLTLEPSSPGVWLLKNNTDSEIAVERIENLDAGAMGLLPRVIYGHDAVEVVIERSMAQKRVTALELKIRGRAELVRVPIPQV